MGAQISNYDGIATDTPPHALVPIIDMPKEISLVDIAYNDAPETHKISIRVKYISMGKLSRHSEDRLLEYIAGVLFGGTHDTGREKSNRKSATDRHYKRATVIRI